MKQERENPAPYLIIFVVILIGITLEHFFKV